MPLLLMSFVVGWLTGLTSMGGAALMTPFLLLVVGVRPLLAVGTDLVYGAVTRLIGAWMHFRHGAVDLRAVRHLACGSIPGGFAGFFMLQFLLHSGINPDRYLRHAIGIVLVVVSSVLLIRSLYPFPEKTAALSARLLKLLTIGWGALVGLVVGITSVGSGSLIAPFLLALYPKTPARAVGTDVFHSALLVSTTALLYTNAGAVEWKLVPTLLAGSVPGVLLGSYCATRLPIKSLRVSMSLVLLATGIKML